MRHIDLFSGIGGFALAADRVWENVEHIFVDNDPFCQKVLKKHWPSAKIHGDIRTFTYPAREQDQFTEQGGLHSKPSVRDRDSEQPFILTGGFPCQPFSAAGKRKGTEDDRHLWPQMFRIIREVSPEWVVGENVRGLTNWDGGVVFDQVQADLESAGYEVLPFLLPACALNAPHRRDRIWIVGHAKHDGLHATQNGQSNTERSNGNSAGSEQVRQPQGADSLRHSSSHASSARLEGRPTQTIQRQESQERSKRSSSDASNLQNERRGTRGETRTRFGGDETPLSEHERDSWSKNWLEVASTLCGVDDGLPVRVDGFELTKAQHRVQRLKSLGNAIVPQVAEQIFRAIKEYDQ